MESIQCDLCNESCESRGTYLDHLETHVGATLLCRLCHKSFRNKYLFLYHKETSTCEQKNTDCQQSVCSQTVNKKKVSMQLKKPKTSNFKQCSQCNMCFQHERHFKKHMEGHKRNNCGHCSALFTNRKVLIAHLAKEHKLRVPVEDHQCKFCDKRFTKRMFLFKHYREHANGQWVCMTCGMFFKSEEDHDSHQVKHNENKRWNCERCHESFSRRQQYLSHMKNHEKYKCKDCGECFASKCKFQGHKQTVHQVRCVERRHECSECGQRFPRPNLLMLHIRIHTGEKPHECEDCGKRYRTPKDYAQHLHITRKEPAARSHPRPKNVKCPDCELKFHNKRLLDRHVLRTHRQDFCFRCEYCEQKFNCKENMKRHLALHLLERQFVCEHCAAAFRSLNALKDHISYLHSQVREFVCALCGMSFKRNSGLNRHMASHSEDRPFVCNTCGNAYKRSSHLRRHKESMHGEVLKSQKLVRLKQNESGEFVPVEEDESSKERKKKKNKQLEEEAKMFVDGEKPMSRGIASPPTPPLPPPLPPPPVPSPISTPSERSSPEFNLVPSPLPSLVAVSSRCLATALVQSATVMETPVSVIAQDKPEALSAVLPLVDSAEVDQFQDLCGEEGVISGNINLTSNELVSVSEANEMRESDDEEVSAFSGNILRTIVSYNMGDFPTSLASESNSESQLVFTTSVPVSSINIDHSHTVLTLTFDPLLESESDLKHESFQPEKESNVEVESPLLLDPTSSSHMTLDCMSDSLYIPSVSMDRASTLITSTDTVLSSSAVTLKTEDATLGSTLISSSPHSAALFSSVDSGFGPLPASEVLLNMQSHIDSLSNTLNITVSDCESLLSSQNSHSQTSPSMILTQETDESISLDSSSTIAILPDYLPNFSFLNV